MWSEDGLGIPWMVVSLFVFAFCAVFAGLCKSEHDYEAGKRFAIVALTAYLWPVYITVALICGLIELVGMAFGIEHPIRAILRIVKFHPWER